MALAPPLIFESEPSMREDYHPLDPTPCTSLYVRNFPFLPEYELSRALTQEYKQFIFFFYSLLNVKLNVI